MLILNRQAQACAHSLSIIVSRPPDMKDSGGAHSPLLPEVRREEEGKGASVSGAVFNVSTSIIGAGIMSIPATLKVLGVVPAFLLILIVAVLADVSVDFLLKYTTSGKTYAGVVGESFGRVGSVVLQLCVMLTTLGCLIIFLIIIGKFSS